MHISHTNLSTELRLFYESAPVREKIKPAVLFNVKNYIEESSVGFHAKNLGLEYFALTESGRFSCFLIYDPQLLASQLSSPGISQLLNPQGYPREELYKKLEHLSRRFKSSEFPHEVGAFLGYPPEDIDGFIKNKGKNFKLCRYWKVYGDIQYSLSQFRLIDLARDRAKQAIIQYI